METKIVKIKNPDTYEIIMGQGNFAIGTVNDIFKNLKNTVPEIECGVAMNEAKPQLTRVEGNNDELKKLAGEMCKDIGAGHVFVVYMKNAFPMAILNELSKVKTVVNIYAATSNPLEVIVAETELGKSVIGVVDGLAANAIENDEQRKERYELLKKLGFEK